MFFSKKLIYADASASTPLIPQAKKRLVELLDIYANPGGIHESAIKAKEILESARKEIAECIGAHADEIVFTASGTEANNLALGGVLEGRNDVTAITLSTEHPSVLETLHAHTNTTTIELGVEKDGLVSLSKVEEAITEKVVLISVAFINSELGVIQDVRAIAKSIRAERKKRAQDKNQLPIYFHIDASQAPLWVRLTVDQLHPDLMTLDAQKCGGPKGVGLLYVRRGTPLRSQIRGGSQERGLRAGTENVPLIGSFACALSIAQKECEKNSARVAVLRDELLTKIKEKIEGVTVNGSLSYRVANNLNISIEGLVGEMAVIALSAKGIEASTRSACSSDDEDESHVLLAIGASKKQAQGALRFTFLPSVSTADITRIAETLLSVTKKYHGSFDAKLL